MKVTSTCDSICLIITKSYVVVVDIDVLDIMHSINFDLCCLSTIRERVVYLLIRVNSTIYLFFDNNSTIYLEAH